MPPVISAPTSDVDNEATAELPVLDVAAYESTIRQADAEGEASHTDTWVMPTGVFVPAALDDADQPSATAPVKLEAIPTLSAAAPAYDIDHSGTHEIPAMLPSPARRGHPAPAPVALPPSPPLIEELRGALAAAERRITELNERARIADAERSVAVARASGESDQLRQQLATHLEALATARGRLGVQRTDQAELQDACDRRGDRIAALERELAAQAGVLADIRVKLAASEQRCETLDRDGMNLRAGVARRDEQIAMIEADLVARQHREAALKARLDEALASVDADVPDLRREIALRDQQLRESKSELEVTRARVREKEADLEAAEEHIRQLESDLRDKSSKLQEASVTVEEWRAVIAESQRSILQRDSVIQQLESDLKEHRFSSTLDTAARTGEEPALEGPMRVLIRTNGNTDIVHVLGRRTRIGRGSDNELVLDTKHISRYHAVLLAGPVNTSIEDLNSTNGVFVNGKRVTRQVLQDGDRVTVGRTQFRYSVRD